jgi:2-phosphosulfolactate phosphatase
MRAIGAQEPVPAAHIAAAPRLKPAVRACSSGRELIERGYASNAEIAADLDESACVPVLNGACFTPAAHT